MFGKSITIEKFVKQAARQLGAAHLTFGHGTVTAYDDAAFLLLESLNLPPDALKDNRKRVLTAPEQAAVQALIDARIRTRKPSPYLTHRAWIQGLPFFVDERVIVPRSFIGEILCAADGFGPPGCPAQITRVLDLCTGSGCLAILAAHVFPDAQVDAVDVSRDALEVARENVAAHNFQARVTLHHGDLFAPLAGKSYDLILTNPPYVDAGGMRALPPEYRHEPALALDGGADGTDLVRRIIDEAPEYLTPQGALLCEVGRCRDTLEAACPQLPFLWLATAHSDDEVFWITRRKLERA